MYSFKLPIVPFFCIKFCSLNHSFIMVLYTGYRYRDTVQKIKYTQQLFGIESFWSVLVWFWRNDGLLCLCSHCLAQSNITFDNTQHMNIQSSSLDFPPLIKLSNTGSTVVCTLGYSREFIVEHLHFDTDDCQIYRTIFFFFLFPFSKR